MVQAILDGRKTETRQVVKPQPHIIAAHKTISWKKSFFTSSVQLELTEAVNVFLYDKCPYGKPGDVLWVRESFMELGFVGNYVFKADDPIPLNDGDRWKPSIHMPKAAARIWLEVTEVKVERLQDITEESAIAEGIESTWTVNRNPGTEYKNYYPPNKGGKGFSIARWSFQSLWQSINGAESWTANPWVWVIKFKVLSTTGKPQSLITNP